MFFTLFGYWLGGGAGFQGMGTPTTCSYNFTLGSSKIEVLETYFFDIVIT